MIFTDPAIDIPTCLARLQTAGLTIPDTTRAERYLTFIGFHRLNKYSKIFRDPTSNQFYSGITFDNLLNLYIFDRKLRLHVLDGIERIEVAFRTVISNTMSLSHGPHWYLDRNCVNGNPDPIQIARETSLFSPWKQEGACKDYYTNFKTPCLPPSWVVTETMTFGAWSKVYKNIKIDRLKTDIANKFGLTLNLCESWFRALCTTRNYCAHHRRFWNRRLVVNKPIIPNQFRSEIPQASNDSVYSRLAILSILLGRIINSKDHVSELQTILASCPVPYHAHMGFPAGWETYSIWN